ncbi:hypothetical protein SRHO_G00121120 [Serrasalmus rhombeus]
MIPFYEPLAMNEFAESSPVDDKCSDPRQGALLELQTADKRPRRALSPPHDQGLDPHWSGGPALLRCMAG